MLATSLFLVTLFLKIKNAIPIICETVIGSSSGNADDALSTVLCSSSSYTMVSCGIKTVTTSEFEKQGSWISGQTCYAQNAYQGDGVLAYGRCCDLSLYDFSCTHKQSTASTGNDGSLITQQCENMQQVLMGCSIVAAGNNLDGCYPGNTYPQSTGVLISSNNECTSVVSISHEDVHSFATCCNSNDIRYSFECYQRWSSPSNTNVGAMTSISCPSTDDYFMTGCSGIGLWANMNQYNIENNICYARNSRNSYHVYAIAICCKLIVSSTSNPTKIPTLNPSSTPTLNPTWNPSTNPTITPTTFAPTFQPTSNPTFQPTANPTLQPTVDPTFQPTLYPTFQPTLYPTLQPTLDPTLDPVQIPSTMSPRIVVVVPTKKTHNDNEGSVETTTVDTKPTNDHIINGKDDNSFWYQYLIYIIIGFCVILFCIFIIISFIWFKKRKHKKIENMMTDNQQSTGIQMVKSSDINTSTITKPDIDMNNHEIIDNEDSEQIYNNNNNNNDDIITPSGTMMDSNDEKESSMDNNNEELYGDNNVILSAATSTTRGDHVNNASPSYFDE